MRSVFGDILAALWLPVFSGTAAAAITWLVWYYAGGPAVPGSEAAKLCAKAALACYITPSALHYSILHSGIFITLTGGPDIMLFIRERRRNERERREAEERRQEERKEAEERHQQEQERQERMFNLLQTALDQAHTERRLADERAAEERRLAEERYRQDQQRAAEERRLAEERYRQDQQRAAEERRLAEERYRQDQQAFANILAQFAATIAGGARQEPEA